MKVKAIDLPDSLRPAGPSENIELDEIAEGLVTHARMMLSMEGYVAPFIHCITKEDQHGVVRLADMPEDRAIREVMCLELSAQLKEMKVTRYYMIAEAWAAVAKGKDLAGVFAKDDVNREECVIITKVEKGNETVTSWVYDINRDECGNYLSLTQQSSRRTRAIGRFDRLI